MVVMTSKSILCNKHPDTLSHVADGQQGQPHDDLDAQGVEPARQPAEEGLGQADAGRDDRPDDCPQQSENQAGCVAAGGQGIQPACPSGHPRGCPRGWQPAEGKALRRKRPVAPSNTLPLTRGDCRDPGSRVSQLDEQGITTVSGSPNPQALGVQITNGRAMRA